MRPRVTLREWGREYVELSPEIAAALQDEYSTAIDVTPVRGNRYRLSAKSRVGTIVLPDLEVRVLPKCGLTNLLWMLGWAYGLTLHRPEPTEIEEIDDARDLLLLLLVDRVEQLLRRGIRRSYIDHSEELPGLRGRLDFDRHMRRPPGSRLTLPCRFEDYTDDLPFNQIIAFTLRVAGSGHHPQLAMRLHRARTRLGHLTRRRFRAADFDTFSYDRLTEHYRPIHTLCRIVLDARGAEANDGQLPIGSFLVDMNLLFERFVAAWLASHLEPPWRLATQAAHSFDELGMLSVIPDLVLMHSGRATVVADTKYKVGTGGTPDNSDAYQALAYCRVLGVKQCVLIYPDLDGSRSFPIVDGDNEVVTDGLRLGGTVRELDAGMNRVLTRLLQRACRRPSKNAEV